MQNMRKWIALFLTMLLPVLPAAAEEESTMLTGKTATEIVEMMGFGWNLGNTLDATGGNTADVTAQEQSWGNAKITPELMVRVKEAGFDTIRIPVTWYRYTSDDGTYTIREDFLQHVREVVEWAREADLFVILNMHHEAWINEPNFAADAEKIGEQLTAMWRQIAVTFADFDQHVIFEGMNEPRAQGTNYEWGGNAACYAAVNYLNQVFVNTIRKDAKGCNAERCLMIPGYAATSSPAGTAAIALPTVDGEAAANIIVSVHSYDPQTFCLQDTQTTFDPEKDGAKINRVFENIKETFLDRGIPVVMGETGATNTNGNHDERAKWAYCVAQNAQRYGVPIVIWDNGNNQTSGGECHAWIRRAVNPKLRSQATSVVYPQVLDALWEGKNSAAWGSALTEVRAEADESILWANADGLTSQKEWDSSYIQLEAKMEWFADGARIGIRYSGAGTPKLVLDSAEKSVWWIPVDAASVEQNADGTKTAWFTSEILLAEMRKNGVDTPAQLQNCYVIATNGKITAYRITVEGMATALTTYHVNGSAIHQADLPDAPTYPHMTFCGWYTTPDYQPGTEVTGASGASDAWAKMALDMSVIK